MFSPRILCILHVNFISCSFDSITIIIPTVDYADYEAPHYVSPILCILFVTFSLLYTTTLFIILLPDTLNLCSSLRVTDEIPHPHENKYNSSHLHSQLEKGRTEGSEACRTIIQRNEFPPKFFVKVILICQFRSQVFEPCHIFQKFIACFYITFFVSNSCGEARIQFTFRFPCTMIYIYIYMGKAP